MLSSVGEARRLPIRESGDEKNGGEERREAECRGVEILAGCGTETRELMLETRAAIRKMFPALIECADVKSGVIGYGHSAKYADMICSMMPAKGWVTLGIAYAAAFPDPEKIMEGAGKVHRHVKIRNKSDLESSALKAILQLSNEEAVIRAENNGKRGSQ